MALKLDAENINLTNRTHLYALIREIEGAQNIERKKNAFIAFECQEGRQKYHVKKRLAVQYPETHEKFRIGNVEIVKKIIRKKAKAYKTAPIRSLDTDAESLALEGIYDKFKFSRAFKEADRIYNLHKYVALWLSYKNPDDDGLDLDGTYGLQALAPYEYDLVRNDKGVPVIFALSYGGTDITQGADGVEQVITEDQRDTAAETKRFSFWSKDHFVKVSTKGVTEDGEPFITELKTIPNPIRRLPIAFLSQDTAADYPIPSALADKAIDFNVDFSDLRTSVSAQGHGQLVISAPENMKLRQVHMGMHTAINLPQSKKADDKATTAEYISASPDLSGALSVLQFTMLQIMDDEGITAKSAIEGGIDEAKSGFDRVLKEADVQAAIEDNQELYSDCLELDVYLTLKSFEDALNNTIFKSETITTTFSKPKVLTTDKEVRDSIAFDEENGLSLSYEKHMVLDPNISKEKAIEREAEIQVEQEAKAARIRKLLGSGDDENEDDNIDPDKKKEIDKG